MLLQRRLILPRTIIKGVAQFLIGEVKPVSLDCALERWALEIYLPGIAAATMQNCFYLRFVCHGLSVANLTPGHYR